MRTSKNLHRWAGCAAGVALAALAVSWADPPSLEKAAAPDGAPAAAGQRSERPEGPKRFGDFAELTKDMQASEGLFTIYRFDTKDKNRDPERLLARIPARLLSQDMLFATSISSGGNLTAWMWTDYLFRWEIAGNHLKMVIPDMRYISNDDKPIAEAIRRTYGSSYIATLPIMAMTNQGDVLVDLGPLLKSNVADVPGGGAVRADISEWSKVKVFPENVLIDVNLAVGGGQQGRHVGVSYAFQQLPKLGGYKPRLADPRLGYFTTVRVDWSKPNSERDVAERYINRWHLEKRDASLELSPPKKPITFIIEKTVPIQWRRWVRQGVEQWNSAYEKIGFTDAIVVHQQTDDNEFKDYDPEDSRYNFVRWTVTGRALAVGPSRADPRTGQILDADIIIDDAWVRAFVSQFDVLGPAGVRSMKGPGWDLMLQQYPDFIPHLLRPTGDEPISPFDERRQALAGRPCQLHRHDGRGCEFAEGLVEELALAQFAMIATGSGKQIPERLIGEALREIVAHEVGHTLGLRHNFKGSNWLSLEEIKNRRNVGDAPTVASVMDYNPLLFFADDEIDKVRHFITPMIGPYDDWVIEYGYRVPGKNEKGEAEMLKEIASRSTQSGLDYATDEDTLGSFSPDPGVNRYDMGNNPMEWAASRQALVEKLAGNIEEWAAKSGEPRYYVTQAYNILLSQYARNYQYVGRLIGGQYFHRDHIGDPNARPAFVLVDAETQRNALRQLGETVLSDNPIKIVPELLNNLAAPRWSDFAGSSPNRIDYPIHDRIATLQLVTLVDLLSPPVLQRVYDAELKTSEPNKFTAAELLQGVRAAIWPQLTKTGGGPYTDAKPLINSIARNLQNNYLNMMFLSAIQTPGVSMAPDLHQMVRFTLRELSASIESALSAKGADGRSPLDFATRAHLTERKSRIDRVLDAQYQAR